MAEETMLVKDGITQRKTRLQARRSGLSAAKQAELEKLLQGTSARVIPARTADAPVPLTFAQERLWFLDRWSPDVPSTTYLSAFASAESCGPPRCARALMKHSGGMRHCG